MKARCRFISHRKAELWGVSIVIMESKGKACVRLYQYNDDNATVYLEGLSVDEGSRGCGIGAELLEIFEKTGRNLGATAFCLWVEKGSWMHSWYKRRGYSDLKDHEEANCVWMAAGK